MTHVFISYARQDGSAHAQRLDADLKRAGYAVWYDKRNTDPARDFTAEIERGIKDASHVVVCVTPDSVRDDSFVRREVQYSIIAKKRIYVALLDNDTLPHVNISTNTFFKFHEDWKVAFTELCDHLARPASDYKPIIQDSTADHPLRGYVQRLYESANQHLETAIIRLIDLDIDDSPEAVPIRPQPLDDIGLLFGDAKTETTFTTFAEAFIHFNRRAMLLGEPGGGKTVTLMATARQAAADWLNDPDHNPLPILALISTWDSIKQPSLIDWLGSKKDLSPEPVREVMTTGRALLLLDGLDELGAERTEKLLLPPTPLPDAPPSADGLERGAGQEVEERYDPRQRFITALNAGLGKNATLVTCREEEYNAIGKQVALEGAVRLRQLTPDQICAYLSADPGLAPLQAAIDADEGLLQMSRTPLLLSYLAFGFRDRPEALRDLKDLSAGDLRDAVFMSYMDKRYEREVKRLAKMGQEPPFALEFIKEMLGRVAMENAGGMWRRKKGNISELRQDNLFELQDFAHLLQERPHTFLNMCIDLHYLRTTVDTISFIHIRLRDTLAYRYSNSNLTDLALYSDHASSNPAIALGSIRDTRSFDILLNLYNEDKSDPEIRRSAASGLVRLGDSRLFELFLTNLSHEISQNRSIAAFALGKLRDPRAIPYLIEALGDSAPEVRHQSSFSLANLPDPAAVGPLISLATDPDGGVRWAATFALGVIHDPKAYPHVLRNLNDPDTVVRGMAALSLGVFKNMEAVEALIKTLNDPIYLVGRTAAASLESIGTPEALAAVAEWRARGGDKA